MKLLDQLTTFQAFSIKSSEPVQKNQKMTIKRHQAFQSLRKKPQLHQDLQAQNLLMELLDQLMTFQAFSINGSLPV